MDLGIVGAAVIAAVSFVAGWLVHTERMRTEVYAKRFDVYLKLNTLAADVLHLSIKTSVDAQEFTVPMVQARLALAECMTSHSILVSKAVGPHIEKLVEGRTEPDLEALRQAFNRMSNQMAEDLKLGSIYGVNSALLSFGGFRKEV